MGVSKIYSSALSVLQVLEPFSNKAPPKAPQLEVLPDALWIEWTWDFSGKHPLDLGVTYLKPHHTPFAT